MRTVQGRQTRIARETTSATSPSRRRGDEIGVGAAQPGEIQIEDQLERRIRKPVDLLRCFLSCIEIVALALAGVAASATTAGLEKDIVGASNRLPHALRVVAPRLALFALIILPVALAVQLLARRDGLPGQV